MGLLTKHRGTPGGDRRVASHTIGNALVVHLRDALRQEVRDLALSLAEDPDHQLVVVDLPANSSFAVWESAARLMPRKRSGVRLVIGDRSRETTTLAGQWLSERLGRTIVAPDGRILPGVDGSLFVDSGWGTGWVRFQPGKSPHREGKRFPRPGWEAAASFNDIMPTSANSVVEPLPGGVWLRPHGPENVLAPHRARLVAQLPVQPGVCTVVLGCPGALPVSIDDITRFWGWVPHGLRSSLRLLKLGPVAVALDLPLGQRVANAVGEPVVCYPGLPMGSRTEPGIFLVRPDGGVGWQAFAEELGYRPLEPGQRAVPPELLRHRQPVFGAEELMPGVYRYAPDAVLEVVQSGLWLRPPVETADAHAIRGAEPDAMRQRVLFDESVPESAHRMRQLAEDVLGRLDPHTRGLSVLTPASLIGYRGITAGKAAGVVETARPADPEQPVPVNREPGSGAEPSLRPPAEAGTTTSALEVETRTEVQQPLRLESAPVPSGAAEARPTEAKPSTRTTARDEPAGPPAAEPAAGPAPSAPRQPDPDPAPRTDAPAAAGTAESAVTRTTVVQPTPKAAAAALIPKRGLDEERAWLRRALSAEYSAVANGVGRVLSEHPGFQGAAGRSSGKLLTDAVAVRLYLSATGDQVDQALRQAEVGPHVPFARCAVAGLSRLPSHRGPVVYSVTPSSQEWALLRRRKLLTEWGFISAFTTPCAQQQAEHQTDVLLWSMTSRRTALLEPEDTPATDRVLFVPGTSFKILDLVEPKDGARGQIVLRELGTAEIDASGRVDRNRAALDELAITSLRRKAERWAGSKNAVREPEPAASRFQTLPGLVRTAGK